MAYSTDFRQRALAYYANCGNISKTARTFGITNRTLYQWIALKKETGSLQHQVKGGNRTRVDQEELRRYVAEHPDAYQYEIAQHLGCTASNVGYLLKTLKITRKKRWWCPKKYADIKRQANNDISIVQNFLLKQRNLANLNY